MGKLFRQKVRNFAIHWQNSKHLPLNLSSSKGVKLNDAKSLKPGSHVLFAREKEMLIRKKNLTCANLFDGPVIRWRSKFLPSEI